jgi:hypothetical protein
MQDIVGIKEVLPTQPRGYTRAAEALAYLSRSMQTPGGADPLPGAWPVGGDAVAGASPPSSSISPHNLPNPIRGIRSMQLTI